MAKLSSSSTKRNKKSGGVMGKLQRTLSPSKTGDGDSGTYYDVPKDVKQGHFAVLVVDDEEPNKRFVVPLTYLANPAFLRLLEHAAEEYGFDHEGALTIPCRPSELEMIFDVRTKPCLRKVHVERKKPAFSSCYGFS